jgi:hypothetical protein
MVQRLRIEARGLSPMERSFSRVALVVLDDVVERLAASSSAPRDRQTA